MTDPASRTPTGTPQTIPGVTPYEVAELPGVEAIREDTRKYLAYGAVGGFLAIFIGILVVGGLVRMPVDDLVRILTTAGGLLSGVVGAIIGFYFSADR